MKVGLVAVHYPRREHSDQMISRVHRAAEVLAAMPGCLAVDCWLSEDNQAVVTTGFSAARTAGVDFDYDEREFRPRKVFRLVPA